MIYINSLDLQIICQQAEEIYPEECCGLLLGTITPEDKIVTQVWPAENVWNESENEQLFGKNQDKNLSKKNRFTIAPHEMLKAQKTAIEQGCNIIGVYHSHPDHPAIPSESDRAIAWEQYSYLIMSVNNGEIREYRSWILDEDRQFEEEDIKINALLKNRAFLFYFWLIVETFIWQ
jgi:proteasome lid subunit RPN8/RPN11